MNIDLPTDEYGRPRAVTGDMVAQKAARQGRIHKDDVPYWTYKVEANPQEAGRELLSRRPSRALMEANGGGTQHMPISDEQYARFASGGLLCSSDDPRRLYSLRNYRP